MHLEQVGGLAEVTESPGEALFFFNDTATTEIYTLSLHDALPISPAAAGPGRRERPAAPPRPARGHRARHRGAVALGARAAGQRGGAVPGGGYGDRPLRARRRRAGAPRSGRTRVPEVRRPARQVHPD